MNALFIHMPQMTLCLFILLVFLMWFQIGEQEQHNIMNLLLICLLSPREIQWGNKCPSDWHDTLAFYIFLENWLTWNEGRKIY